MYSQKIFQRKVYYSIVLKMHILNKYLRQILVCKTIRSYVQMLEFQHYPLLIPNLKSLKIQLYYIFAFVIHQLISNTWDKSEELKLSIFLCTFSLCYWIIELRHIHISDW